MNNHPFTPEYIRMCKAAKDIQAMRPHPRQLDPGDWIDAERGACVVTHGEQDGFGYPWLPRLDQLVSMCVEKTEGFEYFFSTSRDAHERILEIYMAAAYEKYWDEREGKWV